MKDFKFPKITYDNTEIQAYLNCPRYHFARHVMGWTSEGKSPALAFGSAWHSAMDAVWDYVQKPSMTQEQVHVLANAAFMKMWLEMEMPIDIDALSNLYPRTPGVASEMLDHYIKIRWDFLHNIDIKGIEIPFVVPLYPNNEEIGFIGLIDKVYSDKDSEFVIPLDHKTTSAYDKEYGFTYAFKRGWIPDRQIMGYQYACTILFGKCREAKIDGSLVHNNKTKPRRDLHELLPIRQQPNHINDWLNDTRQIIERIEADKKAFSEGKPCFPQNTANCFMYNRPCQYLDNFCSINADWQNAKCPPNLTVDFWNPVQRLLDKTQGDKND